MNSIFAKMLYELEKNHDLMLVTIISERGSSPRGTGSQMLVNMDGRLLGTIGGGAVEYQAEQLALTLLAQKRSERHDYRLRKNEKEDIGMACGGDVAVWLQYVDAAQPQWGELAQAVLAQISARKPGWLVQKLDGSMPALLGENGEVLAGQSCANSAAYTIPGCMLTEEGFSMPLPIGERAFIFGGGHIARCLAPLLKTVGFRVTVMDNREEFANPADFSGAERVICGDYLKLSDYVNLTGEDFVVVMTNGHSHDYDIQEQILRQETAYVGVIGSRRKTAVVNQRLRQAGVPEEGIAHVHTPVGMSIKAVTPEEIAVSIAGEMILVRATRREAEGERHSGCPMH
ncbi:MAG: XdhC family protein [Oscillospiraceae bacterium]|nr:XdhC family protein [Oscillospiraceae bacterium]